MSESGHSIIAEGTSNIWIQRKRKSAEKSSGRGQRAADAFVQIEVHSIRPTIVIIVIFHRLTWVLPYIQT
jgi:hypothetical protein